MADVVLVANVLHRVGLDLFVVWLRELRVFQRTFAIGHVDLPRAGLFGIAANEGELKNHSNYRTTTAETIWATFPYCRCQFEADFIRLPNAGERYLRVLAEVQEVH